ncbi:unnamed protein product [Effrenium voratum]|uniref:Uncharacterized protein n=1 Tax=Effrenium voratum TaxID=2562239 RepID=A0AA36I4U1_9DINO|nr:unnamed protein product [Effrenium voratum]CAJ1413763.1 unnamed protein product [Effrenium voratum]
MLKPLPQTPSQAGCAFLAKTDLSSHERLLRSPLVHQSPLPAGLPHKPNGVPMTQQMRVGVAMPDHTTAALEDFPISSALSPTLSKGFGSHPRPQATYCSPAMRKTVRQCMLRWRGVAAVGLALTGVTVVLPKRSRPGTGVVWKSSVYRFGVAAPAGR